MKTKEELAAIQAEVEAVSKKLAELTDDELAQVAGGEEQGYSSCGKDHIPSNRDEPSSAG